MSLLRRLSGTTDWRPSRSAFQSSFESGLIVFAKPVLERPRHPADILVNTAAPLIRGVAAEKFVAAIAGKADGDVASRELRDQECWNLRGIGERLVVQSRKARDDRHRFFRRHVELGVFGADVLRHLLGGFCFVEFAIVEADRERLDGALAVGLHDRDDQRGVDAAGKESAERNVGFHAHRDRIIQQRVELVHRFVFGAAERIREAIFSCDLRGPIGFW